MFGGRPIGGLGVPTQKAKNFKGTLLRLLGYLRPYRTSLVVIVVAGAIGTVFSVLGPKVLGLATTKIFEGFIAKATGAPGAGIDFDAVARILLTLIVLYLVGNAFQYLMQYLMCWNRSFGARASVLLTTDTSHAGTSGRADARSFGSPKCKARSRSVFVSPSNGSAPVSIR